MYQNDIGQYLNFRDVFPEDIDKIMIIEEDTYPFPWTREIFSDCLKNRYHCIAIEAHEEMIGYIICSTVLDEVHLLNICVTSSWRKQGVGRMAINWLVDYFKERLMNTIYLEVRPSNINAHQLYLSLGFEEIGIRKGYYPDHNGREDAIVMSKFL